MIWIVRKFFHDQWLTILSIALFCMAFPFFYSWILYKSAFSQALFMYIKFLPKDLLKFIGLDMTSGMIPGQMLAFGQAHPLVMTVLSILPVALPVRYLTRERENHTFDLLMARPLKRSSVFLTFFALISVSIFVSVASLAAGTFGGAAVFNITLTSKLYGLSLVNAFLFFQSMAAISAFFAVFSSEQSKTLSRIVSLLVLLFFYHSIVRLWEQLDMLLSLSYFQLYQPVDTIMQRGAIETHLIACAVISVVAVTAGLFVFRRADL